jgi:hypothetical protein
MSSQQKIANAAIAKGERVPVEAGRLASNNSKAAKNASAAMAQLTPEEKAALGTRNEQVANANAAKYNSKTRNLKRFINEKKDAMNEKARLASMTSAERSAEKKQLNNRNKTLKNFQNTRNAAMTAEARFNNMNAPGTLLEDPNMPSKMDPIGLKNYKAGLKWCEKQWAERAKKLGVPPITLASLDDAVVKLIEDIKGHPEKFDNLVKQGAPGTSQLKQVLLNAVKGKEFRETAEQQGKRQAANEAAAAPANAAVPANAAAPANANAAAPVNARTNSATTPSSQPAPPPVPPRGGKRSKTRKQSKKRKGSRKVLRH